MIKEIIHYVTDDGSEFDNYKDAQEYETVYQRCEEIMSQLNPYVDGKVIRQDIETVKKAYKEFMGLCGEIIPQHKWVFDGVINGTIHQSHAERVLSDYDIECLCRAVYRFMCTNMDSGIEYEQPYYVNHQNEWKGEIL
jgi:hypothetical protein